MKIISSHPGSLCTPTFSVCLSHSFHSFPFDQENCFTSMYKTGFFSFGRSVFISSFYSAMSMAWVLKRLNLPLRPYFTFISFAIVFHDLPLPLWIFFFITLISSANWWRRTQKLYMCLVPNVSAFFSTFFISSASGPSQSHRHCL